MRWFLVFLHACGSLLAQSPASEVARAIREGRLDPNECYRVRDLSITREELRFYFTDGYLIFSTPVQGRRLSAVFTAEVENGDGELLVFPPQRSERLSLAKFAKTPNLDEHLVNALFLFTDGSGEELHELAKAQDRRSPDTGALLASQWNSVARNLAESFEIRLVRDLFAPDPKQTGLFYAAVRGRQIGVFDALYDPRAREQVMLGQIATRNERPYFDVWASFTARSWRLGRRTAQREPIRLANIRIDAQLDAALHLKVTTRMTVRAEAPTAERVVAFDISQRMKVNAARMDGKPVELFARDSLRANLIRRSDDELFLIVLPEPLQQGRDYELELEHEGDVVTQAGNGVYFVGARGNWYPNRGYDFATFDLTFRYPKTLTMVATGDEVDEMTVGDLRVSRWHTSAPVRMAGFNLGEYQKTSDSRAGLRVDVYANNQLEQALRPRTLIVLPPVPVVRPGPRRTPADVAMAAPAPDPDPRARLRTIASDVVSAVEYFTSILGPPPLKTLTVSPIPGAFGQGFPGLIYLSTISYLDPSMRPAHVRNEASQMFYSDLLLPHETAHQWWGNLVTASSYQDEWLMESLANYTALLYYEKKKGRRALDTVLERYRLDLLDKDDEEKTIDSRGPINWGVRLLSSQSPSAWRVITYEKGSWILHMLRGQMGDEAFLKLLAELAKRFRMRSITTEEFRALAAEFLPPQAPDPKLESFFEQWVYSTGIPSLKLSFSVKGKAPRLQVEGSLTQTDVDEDFSTVVPVEIQVPGRKPTIRWIRTSSEPVSFTVPVSAPSAKVQLDPQHWMLFTRK